MTESKLSRVSTAKLRGELQRRRTGLDRLRTRRDRLAAELVRINSEIELLSDRSVVSQGKVGARATRSSKRTRSTSVRERVNKQTLVQVMQLVLKGKTLSVAEITEAVQKAGYKTHAEHFRVIVNNTLLKHRDLFKKVSWGKYTAK